MWKFRTTHYDTGHHSGQELKGSFHQNFWSRFSKVQYCFRYALQNDPGLLEENINLENILLDSSPIYPWLVDNQKGRIELQVTRGTHIAREIIGRYRPLFPLYANTIQIKFSNKDLAMRWKLTWGGKMVTSMDDLI